MAAHFFCGSLQLRDRVRNAELVDGKRPCTGIDHIDVGDPPAPLTLTLIHPAQIAGAVVLSTKHIWIEDEDMHPLRVRNVALDAEGSQVVITVDPPRPGVAYCLRLQADTDKPTAPDGYHPLLCTVEFSAGGGGGSSIPVVRTSSPSRSEPPVDYLAKDYASFRRLMLDRLTALLPGGQEDNPADLTVALVELLAYVGDHLSYYQDAVATEAYLGMARQRISVRRHARLLDYPMHEGCNARAFVCVTVTDPLEVPYPSTPAAGTWQFLTASNAPQVFEPMHGQSLIPAHNGIELFDWGGIVGDVPAGSTRTALGNDPKNQLQLKIGDVLIFETEGDPDPAHRHAVRLTAVSEPATDPLTKGSYCLVEWHAEDALPFSLALSPAAGVSNQAAGGKVIARGNVVLVDHGRRVDGEDLLSPAKVEAAVRPYRPFLRRSPLTYASRVPKDVVEPGANDAILTSATALLHQVPGNALPALTLGIADETWTPCLDLITQRKSETCFVVETDNDGRAWLRFGDDVNGRSPRPDAVSHVQFCRIGSGISGNVGAETICNVLPTDQRISQVRNPLPAAGGVDPEPIEQVRLYAPQAFRTQERAVTANDYAAVAQRYPGVQRAVASVDWTGTCYTIQVVVDRQNGKPVDDQFVQAMCAFLEPYRLAGYDLEVLSPRIVPVELAIAVELKTGFRRRDVLRALEERFSNRESTNGKRGFFHPDNFTFGQPVYLSRIYQAGLAVTGVEAVEVRTLQRWSGTGHVDRTALDTGYLAVGAAEVARLDNNPALPAYGTLRFSLKGGL